MILPYIAGHSTPLCIVPLLKNFIELYSTQEGILHLSRDPVIRFEPSFFCLIALIELFKIKKKIAQIGPVDREIFAKNGIFKFYLVPGGTGSNPRFLQDTRGTMARDIRYTKMI